MQKTGQDAISYKKPALALLIILIITQLVIPQANAATTILTGTILDEATGEPIPEAQLTINYRRYGRYWSNRWNSYDSTTADNEGKYSIRLETDTDYLIIITHVDTEEEHDYVPFGAYYRTSEEQNTEDFSLWQAATINFDGLAYFIETTAIPDTTFRVLEPTSNEIIRYGSMNLVYGPSSGTVSSQLRLPTNRIYVPSGMSFKVEIQSYVSYGGKNIQRTLLINEFNETTLESGQVEEIDLRSHVLPQGIITLENETSAVESLINLKEEEGFFLAVERQQISRIKQTTNTAIQLVEQERYAEAFTKSREAYLLISDLENSLNNMLLDASRSVYILIGFIALTSAIVASILFEEGTRKIISSLVLFIILGLSLYYLHPGSQVASVEEFIKVSVVSLVSANIIMLALPVFMNRSSSGRDVSLINMMVPIFSIAKRSLRRRRLRFVLTLTSILLLVASFISLTSFTSGYGLSFTRTTNTVLKTGVMIRTPDPPPEKAAAPFSGGTGASGPLPLDESLLQWYNQMDEVAYVVPRYENYAQRQYRESYNPIARIRRTPIFGIAAINPEIEATVNHLDSTLVEGRYLGDAVGETLISVELAERLGSSVGDSFSMTSQEKTHELTIVGLLEDEVLIDLTDIDGRSIMPQKIIEWERIEADGPDFVVEALAPCSPDEVIWVNLETGENMSALWLLSINLLLQKDVDVMEFARATALNRGFRAWASTHTGVYLAQLTGYFEGKGLPIVIPWVIVVLNVVVTMMNAYYERRHEVMIYSSIGMNPKHVSSIFLAEAAVIGVIGGCIGYLLGLGAYKIIYVLTPVLQVKQKVSAFWSAAAIGISMMAVLIGGLSALKNSTSITPSLRRRWTIDKKQDSTEETRLVIPVQIYEEEINEYIEFISEKLEQAKKGRDMIVKMLKMTQTGDQSWEYRFIYCSANAQISALYSRNRVIVENGMEKTYTTILYTIGNSDSVKQAGGFMRQIGLEWSLQREEEPLMGTSLKSIRGFDVI